MAPETSTIGGEQSVEQLRRQLAEARELQTATAEIPRAISSSPMDLGGVFAPIAASAARLCDPMMRQSIGWTAAFSPLSHHGPIPAPSTFPLRPGFFVGRDVLDQRTIHVA